MNPSTRAFRLSPAMAARLSFALSLGLTGAATLAAAPALYAQQSTARTDLAIQSDVVKALSSYPDISGEHITATASNGIVTLSGTASSDTAKNQAQVVAATVDGVRSVVNNVTVSGTAASQQNTEQEIQDPADRNQAQPDQQPVQQAQSTDPNQQQAPYTPQAQPQPGSSGNWGKAGPPPDAQNGQIPQQPQGDQSQANGEPDQYPMQDPGEEPGENPAPQQSQGAPPPPQQSPAYGGQPGYPPRPPRPAYPGQSYPAPNQQYAAPNLSATPITIRPGTLLSVRLSQPLDSRHLRGGETFQGTVAQDLFAGQYLVVPRGAVVQGTVIGVKKPGAVRGEAGFALQITSLTLGGQNYPISTDTFASDTHGKGGYTTANTIGVAAIGALIGAAAGGGPGAAIGAVAGGVTGVGLSAATSGPREIMPPETLLTFHLKAPLTISPISLAEVQQLQASVAPPVRRVSRPRPPYPPYPYYYGYPPPPPPPGYYYYPYRYWR